MLLFFGKYFNFEPIERDGLHEIARFECSMGEHVKLADVLVQHDGAGEVERLTQLVQNRHPAG